jgi:hypothetical protein
MSDNLLGILFWVPVIIFALWINNRQKRRVRLAAESGEEIISGQKPGTYTIPTVIGSIIGIGFGKYCGIYSLIVMLMVGIFYFLSRKVFPRSRQCLVVAFSILAGQLGWLSLGLFVAPSGVILDLIILGGFLLWLVVRPSLVATYSILVVQSLALLVNVVTISKLTWGQGPHRSLVMHIILRILSIISLILLQRHLKKSNSVFTESQVGA